MRTALVGAVGEVHRSAYLDSNQALTFAGYNTGNFVFQRAIRDLLEPTVPSVSPSDDLRPFELLVLTTANVLGPTTDMGWLAQVLEQCDANVVVVGLGAQSDLAQSDVQIPAGTRRWLELCRDRAPSNVPNLLVRGEFTASLLARIGFPDAVPVGCPSALLSHEADLGQRLRAVWSDGIPAAIGLVAGIYGDPATRAVDQQFVRLAETSAAPLPWVLQQGPELFALWRRGSPSHDVSTGAFAAYLMPGDSPHRFAAFVRRYGVGFFNVDAWLEHWRRFDLVLGLRFHGVMAALQAGTPAVLVVHDGRTLELAEQCAIPWIRIDQLTGDWAADVHDARCRFDPTKFDSARRRALARYRASIEAVTDLRWS